MRIKLIHMPLVLFLGMPALLFPSQAEAGDDVRLKETRGSVRIVFEQANPAESVRYDRPRRFRRPRFRNHHPLRNYFYHRYDLPEYRHYRGFKRHKDTYRYYPRPDRHDKRRWFFRFDGPRRFDGHRPYRDDYRHDGRFYRRR